MSYLRQPAEQELALRTSIDQVGQRLWIGGDLAPVPHYISLVISLEASSPQADGVRELRFPFRDSRWERIDHDLLTSIVTAAEAEPGHVLIRCRHGLNRSALVAALLLTRRGFAGPAAVARVRNSRPHAFTNPYFRDLAERWPDDPMDQPKTRPTRKPGARPQDADRGITTAEGQTAGSPAVGTPTEADFIAYLALLWSANLPVDSTTEAEAIWESLTEGEAA